MTSVYQQTSISPSLVIITILSLLFFQAREQHVIFGLGVALPSTMECGNQNMLRQLIELL